MTTHKVLDNMHLECLTCGTVRNLPFCPLCTKYGPTFYTPRFDGIDAYEETLTEVRPEDLFKDKL